VALAAEETADALRTAHKNWRGEDGGGERAEAEERKRRRGVGTASV